MAAPERERRREEVKAEIARRSAVRMRIPERSPDPRIDVLIELFLDNEDDIAELREEVASLRRRIPTAGKW